MEPYVCYITSPTLHDGDDLNGGGGVQQDVIGRKIPRSFSLLFSLGGGAHV